MRSDYFSRKMAREVSITPKVLTKAKPVLVKAKDLKKPKVYAPPSSLQDLFKDS